MLFETARILGAAGLTGITCVVLGLLGFRMVRMPPLAGLERLSLALLTGAATLSCIVFAIAAAGAVHPLVFAAVSAGALAAGWRMRIFRGPKSGPPALPLPWRIAAFACFGVFTAIYFLHAMAPELSPDGSYYHLGFVSLYFDHGGFVRVTDNMFAHFPMGVEMLFLYAFAFGRHSAAALVHFLFLGALASSVYTFSARLLRAPIAGLVAAFLVYAAPIIGWDATRAYNDVAVAAIAFGMFHLLEIWAATDSIAVLIPSGMLAGFAFGAKYSAAPALVFGIGFILIRLWHKRRLWIRSVAAFAFPAVAVFAPWAVRNWIWIGNPVSPFLNRWFPNPYIFPSFEREFAAFVQWPEGVTSWLQIPLEVTVRGYHLQGIVGPIFLLAPLMLLACRKAYGRHLCAAALAFLVPYSANITTRFLIPVIPFIAVALALAFAKNRYVLAGLLAFHGITAFPAVVDRYCEPYAMRLPPAPSIKEAFRIIPEDVSLRARKGGYSVARMVDRYVPPGSEFYSFVSIPEAYSHRKGLMYFVSARANMITEILLTPIDASPLFHGRHMLTGLSPDLAPVCRLDYRFDPQKVRAIRLIRRRNREGPLWVITDVRLYSHGIELPHPAKEDISVSACPWYVQYAFDGNPVTLWSPRKPTRAGTFLRANLNGTADLDRVTVTAPRDQAERAPSLEGLTEGNRWVTLRTEPEISIVPPPEGLRRLATAEVRRRGVEYLLMNEGNLIADDFRAHADEWGLQPIAAAENFTLYRIRSR